MENPTNAFSVLSRPEDFLCLLEQLGLFALLFTLSGTDYWRHHSSLKQAMVNLECLLSCWWKECLLYLSAQISSGYRGRNSHFFQYDTYSYIWSPLEIITFPQSHSFFLNKWPRVVSQRLLFSQQVFPSSIFPVTNTIKRTKWSLLLRILSLFGQSKTNINWEKS